MPATHFDGYLLWKNALSAAILNTAPKGQHTRREPLETCCACQGSSHHPPCVKDVGWMGEMGCRQSSVTPLGESQVDERCGIKVKVDPSTPQHTPPNPPSRFRALKDSKSKLFSIGSKKKAHETKSAPPVAFEVSVHDDQENASLIKRHPPKRFRRLDERPITTVDLTHDMLDERLREAEKRRQAVLRERIMSAKVRQKSADE